MSDDIRHLTDEEQVQLHDGDDELDLRWAAEHLASCAACREAQAALARTLDTVSRQSLQEPPEDFERVMWARVSARLETPPVPSWRAWFTWPRLAVAGGAAAVVLVAFLGGRWYGPLTSAPGATPTATTATVAAVAPEQVLLGTAGDHLERTQAVLVELLNADDRQPVAGADRERAADLVAASRLIRQSAADAGETSLATVLEELERVLLEIANDGDHWSPEERDVLRARIDTRGLLFRTRVVNADIRHRGARWD
ncbi:MAG: hypothetical protein IT178_08610 [Acidobacteria bacterium]|nr:hypothetical protein [Acidobacteriota bacterium]